MFRCHYHVLYLILLKMSSSHKDLVVIGGNMPFSLRAILSVFTNLDLYVHLGAYILPTVINHFNRLGAIYSIYLSVSPVYLFTAIVGLHCVSWTSSSFLGWGFVLCVESHRVFVKRFLNGWSSQLHIFI